MLVANSLTLTRNRRRLIDDVSLELRPGEVHAVLGPNGAGKSTLLQLMAGDIKAQAGDVRLDGRDITQWSPQQLARRRAVLPQHESLRFGFTAAEVVALGRLPWNDGVAQTQSIVTAALASVALGDRAAQRYPSLSGGERSRVQFARVLAQLHRDRELGAEASYLLLDEPTASLDLAHQSLCLHQMRRLASEGYGVLAALHDPNQALAFADRVTLLKNGSVARSGAAKDVLTPAILSDLYEVDLRMHVGNDGQASLALAWSEATPAHGADRPSLAD